MNVVIISVNAWAFLLLLPWVYVFKMPQRGGLAVHLKSFDELYFSIILLTFPLLW